MADEKLSPARPSRLWRIVLMVSLALNLAVVGVVAGSLFSGKLREGPPRSFDLGLGPVSRALEPQERRNIGRSLRQDRSLRDMDLRGRVEDMVAALQAEPFDADALRRLMDEQAASMAGIQAKAQAATLEQIIAMSPERRRAFADRLIEELSRRRAPRERNSGG